MPYTRSSKKSVPSPSVPSPPPPGKWRPSEESGPPPAKRQKTALSPVSTDVPVKIQIGDDGDGNTYAIYIHTSRLVNHSTWFEREIASKNVIWLDNVSVEVLQSFSTWIYDQDVEVKEMKKEMGDKSDDDYSDDDDSDDPEEGGDAHDSANQPDLGSPASSSTHPAPDEQNGADVDSLPWYMTSNMQTRGRIFGRLLDLYVFAMTYEIPDLSLAVILAWQRFSHSTKTYPCATVIRQAVSKLGIVSPLVKYLVACYAYLVVPKDVNKERCATIQPEFLVEVWTNTLLRLEGIDYYGAPNDNWCRYHGHKTEAAESECRNDRRYTDPDPPIRRYGGCC